MSKNLSRLVITLASLVLVLWLVFADLGKTNPGEMTTVHADVTTMLGRADCEACHGTGEGKNSLALACLDCHKDLAEQHQQNQGLHSTFPQELWQACGHCHSEHHGRDFVLVSDLAFQLAGIENRNNFDHSILDFTLEGKHSELECTKCHKEADVRVLPKDHKRFAGLNRDCTSCHEDPHKGDMGQDCASCHGQSRPFEEVATFEHLASFPLQGVHSQMKCDRCHEANGPTSMEAEQNQVLEPQRDCVACHKSPHLVDFDNQGKTCVECHGLDQGAFVAARERMNEEDHELCGFSLAEPHRDLECTSCHQPQGADYSVRFPGRMQDACASCHQDPHQGQFLATNATTTNCLDCHQRLAFKPSLFDASRHRQTAFALDGAHLEADCTECHKEEVHRGQTMTRFRGTESACSSCHQDVHQNQFVKVAQRLRIDPECATCHSTTSFSDIEKQNFDHRKWTGFSLVEAHAKAECTACHQQHPKADDWGRRFGRVEELFPKHQLCEDCHQDPHEGNFNRPNLPTSIDGRKSCARCHDQTDFANLDPKEFNHAQWTGFALEGIHARMECTSCHLDARDDQGHGKRLGPASLLLKGKDPALCSSCHEDQHNGVFDQPTSPQIIQGKKSCARCHNQEDFKDLHDSAFDHQRWTGFALRGAHDQAACERCHKRVADASHPQGTLGSVQLLFPRLARKTNAIRCDQCHQDPHGNSFRSAGLATIQGEKTSCDRCHNERSFRITDGSFDHGRFTGFALNGAHEQVQCSQCHQPQPRSRMDGRSFRKARGTDCAACHADPHAGQFRGRHRCLDCHAAVGTFTSGLTFNHQRDARFALDSTHQRLACAKCHRAYPLPGGRTVTRYRPLGTTCKDCHGFR